MQMARKNYDHFFKILFIGESCVGKSAIIKRFSEDKFSASSTSTVGVDFLIKNISIPESGNVVKLQVWDTAGQERYQLVTPIFYRGANAIILVYDVTDKSGLEGVKKWHTETLKHIPEGKVPFVIIGNKNDLQKGKEISTKEGMELAQSLNVDLFFETSAKTGSGIENMFSKVTNELIKRDIINLQEKKPENPKEENSPSCVAMFNSWIQWLTPTFSSCNNAT